MASTRSHAQESQEGGTAAEHAIGHGGAATEHAATTNTDLPRGIATERAFGTCTDLGLLTDVDMAASDDRKTYPILEVAFPNDMWWSLPPFLSQTIYDAYARGNNAAYTWDWGNKRNGSYVDPEGQSTSINRYTIDFDEMLQTNIDNNRKRSVRWVWVCEGDVTPSWSGQIKPAKKSNT